jgi:23S rRNA (cytosine1962-C5)-methyltransferase
METKILKTQKSDGYELLDSGEGFKLERFGSVVVSRPDPQVLWEKGKGELWQTAQARFTKEWNGRKNIPEDWKTEIEGITFNLHLASFKHVGIFPEQAPNWNWIQEKVRNARRPTTVLNLFGYTGGATLAAARAGADVVHVDGSKVSIGIAKQNMESSGLSDSKIRFILDDALAFAKREIRRGNTYDGIVMDPPASGHGPKGEPWRIEKNLPELVAICEKLLSPNPLFLIMNGYAAGYSPIGYKNTLENIEKVHGGTLESGELTLEESGTRRLLPAGIFARWSSGV